MYDTELDLEDHYIIDTNRISQIHLYTPLFPASPSIMFFHGVNSL